MKFFVDYYILPKENNAESECEDTLWYDAIDTLRFALADGASNSSYSGIWASMLVHDYVESKSSELAERIAPLRQRWHDEIQWEALPWYFREKAMRGDHATFLGMSLHPTGHDRGIWKAIAVGDSCLFQIRDNTLIRRFPIQQSAEFTDNPPLVSSVDKNINRLQTQIKGIRGNYKPDDQFIMATDALAEWFLRTCEKGERPWSELDKIGTAEHFHEFIKSLRQAEGIKDDDVSIIRIDLKNVELMVV